MSVMRIGISAGSNDADRVVEQVAAAEADGFSSVWFPGAVGGDPLAMMGLAGRATSSIELGTSVLQTYSCHPSLQASRCRAAAAVAGRPITVGVGPSHQMVVESLGFSYDNVGRDTEGYVKDLVDRLDGELPVLLGALGSRLLRVAGECAAGTILWMANPRAIEEHVVPTITKAAAAAGRAGPRIVAGLPVAVHGNFEEARTAGAEQFGFYGDLPNYQRIMARGGISQVQDAVIVGDEDAVAAQLQALLDAGATDVWAAPFPVGEDRHASRTRTRALLKALATR
jgi:alkanesulfonate monooxygenase SsuD/methylene tetrahydromethanopterin reductase-like flavin-dependent oxidoreductase (luciferase family)